MHVPTEFYNCCKTNMGYSVLQKKDFIKMAIQGKSITATFFYNSSNHGQGWGGYKELQPVFQMLEENRVFSWEYHYWMNASRR